MPQKPLDSEYVVGWCLGATLVAACLCCQTTTLIEACCQVDCGINANGLDEHHEEYLIKYSAVLLRQRAVESPCQCGSGAGIHII